MIFKQKEEVRSGRKTMTQRIDDGGYTVERDDQGEIVRVRKNGRLKWAVGRTYAATPKRGHVRFGNYRITRIRRRPLGEMNEEEAVKEGVNSLAEYRELWRRVSHFAFDEACVVFAIEFEYLGDAA